MVENSNGSLGAPLLGDYFEGSPHSGSNSTPEDEVVVTVNDNQSISEITTPTQNKEKRSVTTRNGQSEPNLDDAVRALQSRTTFQQIRDGHGPHSRDYSRKGSDDPNTGKKPLKRGTSRRSLRNPVQNKSFVARAGHTLKNDPMDFFHNMIWGILLWPKWSWAAIRANSSLSILSVKQGVVAGLASILCVVKLPKPYRELSSFALWAVVTTDLLYESNIGLSVSKGFNRVLGTLAAGCIAVVLNQVGPWLGDTLYPYYVVFCVVVGGVVFRFLKGSPPLKDQWGYAFTVATIAFHLFIITAYTQPERWTLPILRFSMILLGFAMSTIVNVAIRPIYAGDTLHKLVAKNFETAAYVFQRCVEEYNKDTKLDHVPDILSGRSVDDKIHQSYHEVVMSDSDIDKLLSAVHWEPCHGKFFTGYPWHLYDDITDYLRYTLYDVIALDSCLRANVQAPMHLRELFAQEMATIAIECATVLRTLGDSMKNMKKFASEDIMRRAEEAAVALQYKIYLHTYQLLGRGALDSPRYTIDAGSQSPFLSIDQKDDQLDQGYPSRSNSGGLPDVIIEEGKPSISTREDCSGDTNSPSTQGSPGRNQDGRKDLDRKTLGTILNVGSPAKPPLADPRMLKNLKSRSGQSKAEFKTMGILPEGLPAVSNSIPSGELSRSSSNLEPEHERKAPSGKAPGGLKRSAGWKENFLQRKSSLGHNWDGTLERISALSLVKFASLLIEVVSKLKYVVETVEDLSVQARFQE